MKGVPVSIILASNLHSLVSFDVKNLAIQSWRRDERSGSTVEELDNFRASSENPVSVYAQEVALTIATQCSGQRVRHYI